MNLFSEDHKEIQSGKIEDNEGYFVKVEMDKIEQSLKKLKKVITSPEQNFPAWVQSKITKSSDYLDTVADYLFSDVEMSKNISFDINKEKHKKSGKKHRQVKKIEVAPTSAQEQLPNVEKLGPRLPKFEEETSLVDKILSEMLEDKPGCKTKKAKSLEDIAKMHKVSLKSLEKQLEKGMEIEMEHTTSKKKARIIALHHLEEIPDYYDRLIKMEKEAELKEDLRDWFGKGKKGGVGGGGWDRYNTEGERVGKCGDAKEGDSYSACLSKEKANKLGKKGIASFVRRKRDAQDEAGYDEKGEGPKGRKPVFVKTKVDEEVEFLEEKNEPTDPELWSRAKSLAKQKFDVYPSAYANAWASKWYKKRGGSWKSLDEAVTRLPMKTGNLIRVLVNWRGRHLSVQMFFPQVGIPRRNEIENEVAKVYPNARVLSYAIGQLQSDAPIVQVQEESELLEFKKSNLKCNEPKSDPVGDSKTGKSHVVKACEGGKERLIRFGQRGVKGSPKKKGESKKYRNRRLRFKSRHRKNIKRGKMSAAYWADKVKW